MKLISLTLSNKEFNSKEIIINADYIVAIYESYRLNDNSTIIQVAGDYEIYYSVEETLLEIKNILGKALEIGE